MAIELIYAISLFANYAAIAINSLLNFFNPKKLVGSASEFNSYILLIALVGMAMLVFSSGLAGLGKMVQDICFGPICITVFLLALLYVFMFSKNNQFQSLLFVASIVQQFALFATSTAFNSMPMLASFYIGGLVFTLIGGVGIGKLLAWRFPVADARQEALANKILNNLNPNAPGGVHNLRVNMIANANNVFKNRPRDIAGGLIAYSIWMSFMTLLLLLV